MFLNDRDQIIRITLTNEYRDFVFENLRSIINFIQIDYKSLSLRKSNEVIAGYFELF